MHYTLKWHFLLLYFEYQNVVSKWTLCYIVYSCVLHELARACSGLLVAKNMFYFAVSFFF